MQINVSGLLREFPKAKRAALAGERVHIKTREGNLILMAEKPAGKDADRAPKDSDKHRERGRH